MHDNKPFNQSRRRLAGSYAAVMGIILSLCGLTAYQMLAYAHWQAIAQELESVSGTLHDSLESKLMQPGQLSVAVEQALPGLCIIGKNCINQSSDRHILGIVRQGDYYIRFLDQSGRVVAVLGQPPKELPVYLQQEWQTLNTHTGTRYQQISLLLKATDRSPWGYMQIGRSLKEYDDHLGLLKLLGLLGLPIAMLLVGAASWGLAGLAMQPVYQSYKQMQQFTADAAHELRTPVAAIRAIVEATHDFSPLTDQDAQSALAAVERQNTRLAHLVQDLLLLSRMEQKTSAGKQSPCCLNDLIGDLVESLSVLETAAHVKLLTQMQAPEPLYVMGDENQLCRLISNLVTNALQYTPAGGKVTVILGRDDHQAVIHVQDTGIGIAPKDQSRIFERFYRVNSDRSRHTGGSGLGLAISSAIAQAHKGRLSVSSELNQGSLFTLTLPLIFLRPSKLKPRHTA